MGLVEICKIFLHNDREGLVSVLISWRIGRAVGTYGRYGGNVEEGRHFHEEGEDEEA